jgi:hypothetical protein
MVSQGGNGAPGANYGGQAPGGYGGAAVDLSIFEGGGGGGGGGGCYGYCSDGGRRGGNGGGAAFFGGAQNITITGSINADGQNGAPSVTTDGSSGGGAGGYLWFSAANTWTNDGTISARGGAGGGGGNGGSGGYVVVDPLSIVNDGIIDVSGGYTGGVDSGLVSFAAAEVTGDGTIAGSIAPEPSSLALAAIPFAAILLRRKRRSV